MIAKNLSERLGKTIQKLIGINYITAKNIQDTVTEIYLALLDADVAQSVVGEIISSVQSKAVIQKRLNNLRSGEMLIKIVYEELVNILGSETKELNLRTKPPAVILLVGLQGSGKTTTAAKIALWLKDRQKKSVLLTSVDVYRPAAIEQLEILAKQIDIPYFQSKKDSDPLSIAQNAIKQAKKTFADVIIIDTAGRLHIDEKMMQELKQIAEKTKPIETLLVVDSMTGQDAAQLANTMSAALSLTGIILTKTDSDTRGGAALSMKTITQRPIKFIGTGEKLTDFEQFHPDRMASRILGMGDILTLVEETQQKVDQEKAAKLAKKFQKGIAFDLEDFKDQLQQMKNMGGISNLLKKLPNMGGNMSLIENAIPDGFIEKSEKIINSMTIRERRFPHIINGSRKKRIAKGAGVEIQDINKLLKHFAQSQKLMKKMKGGKFLKMLQNISRNT